MKRLSLALFVFAAAMLSATSAFADTFDFSFSGLLFSGSGTFTATAEGGGDYLITAVTGEVDGTSIAGILAPDSYPTGRGEVANDNILIYPPQIYGTEFFDDAGLSFALSNRVDVNLNDTYGFETAVSGTRDLTEFDTVSVVEAPDASSVTPEPQSLVLLGTGILGVAGAFRRRIMA